MALELNGTTGVSAVQAGIVTDEKLDLSANSAEVKEALNATGSAPIYACRAWVNFDGDNITIRDSGNVSSVTRSSLGDFDVNFETSMPDSNYSVICTGQEEDNSDFLFVVGGPYSYSAANANLRVRRADGGRTNAEIINVAVFR